MIFIQKRLPNKTRFNRRLVRRNKHSVSWRTRVVVFGTAALAFSGIALADPTGGVLVFKPNTRVSLTWDNPNVGSKSNYAPAPLIVQPPINHVPAPIPAPLIVPPTAGGARFTLPAVISANLRQLRSNSDQAYSLDLRGDGLITFRVDADAAEKITGDGKTLGINNASIPQARSGQVEVTAATVSQVVNSVINLGGVVDADMFTAADSGSTDLVASPQ